MPDVELDRPESLHEVDHEASPFRRRIAVAVVLVTLFGSVLAYFQSVESNKEENAARDAAIFAIDGLGAQVDASSGFQADTNILVERELLRTRQVFNANRADQTGDDANDDALRAGADRLGTMADAVADQSPLTRVDATSSDELFAELDQQPDQDRIRQGVRAQQANDHGSKADTYVAVITVLAVALFLLGLSLTVQGRARLLLAAPGVAIAVVCVAWSVTIALRDVDAPSEAAIRRTAEAGRALTAGRPDDAIDILDEVIEDEPRFAPALARRGQAHFLSGVNEGTTAGFVSVTDPEALERAVVDLEAAVGNGFDGDVNTVADLGFFTFLQGDFDRSVELSEAAAAQNDQLAQVWFNLGVAHVGQGDERAAARAYLRGVRLLEEEPQAGLRDAVISGGRTDLRIVRDIDGAPDDVEDLARRFEGQLSDLQLRSSLCAADGGCADAPGDAAAADVELVRAGRFMQVTYTADDLDEGTPVAAAFYYRPDGTDSFETSASLTDLRTLDDPGAGFGFGQADVCPAAGDYEVELWAPGGVLLGTASATVEPGPLGEDFELVVDGPEGFTFCVPDGFTRADEETSTGGVVEDFVAFNRDDLSIGINVLAGPVGRDPAQAVEEVVLGFADPDTVTSTRDVSIEAEQVGGGVTDLPAATVSFSDLSGTPTSAIVAVGEDGVTRFVTVIGSDDPAVVDEIISLLRFTGLPATP